MTTIAKRSGKWLAGVDQISAVLDIGKHPDTQGHAALQLGMMLLIGGHLNTPDKMRKFINGFN